MSDGNRIGLDAEYRLLREECGRIGREDLVLTEIRGAEGAEYLQGQLTNDIERLEPGQGCYAALLDNKGKMQTDMRVLARGEDSLLIISPVETASRMRRHLTMYSVGREIELIEVEDREVVSMLGPATAEALGKIPLGKEHSIKTIRFAEQDVDLVATDLGADLIVAGEGAGRLRETLDAAGVHEVSPAAGAILRVESGRPAYGREMGPETIPQEAGLNERAVSFEKGCYIGQETVARLHYKGKPNRHLRRLRSEQPLEDGSLVHLGERELGSVGTAVLSPALGPVALAILRREAEPGSEVTVGDGIVATVEEIQA